jgi:hypothetical protein
MCISMESALDKKDKILLHLTAVGGGVFNNNKTHIILAIIIAILGIE